jgi:hypothetical protein
MSVFSDDRPAIEFVRVLDGKGRLALPGCIAERFASRVRILAVSADVLLIEPAFWGQQTTRVLRDYPTRRVTLPVEFRQAQGLRPGVDMAIATCSRGALVWRLEGREDA